MVAFAETMEVEPAELRSIENLHGIILGFPYESERILRRGVSRAPTAVREASRSFSGVLYPPKRSLAPLRIVDLGDIKDVDLLSEIMVTAYNRGIRTCIIGGDHTITYYTVRALGEAEKEIGVIVFDSHLDFMDEWPPGCRIGNSTVMRRIFELPFVKDNIVIVGVRGYTFGEEEIEFVEKEGIAIISMDEIVQEGFLPCIRKAYRLLSERTKCIYLSIDMDVVDPAYAPGVTTPEPGGITSRDLIYGIRWLSKRVRVFDIVEITPDYDLSEITSKLAAAIIMEMMCPGEE